MSEAAPLSRADIFERMQKAAAIVASSSFSIKEQEAVSNERIQRQMDALAASTAVLRTRQKEGMDELARLTELLRTEHGEDGKSFYLRSGVVSIRDSHTTEVSDVDQLMAWMRSHRKLRLVSDAQPRKLNKTKLAKLLQKYPKLAEKLAGIAWIQPHSRLTFKPVEVQVSLERELTPLRKEVNRS